MFAKGLSPYLFYLPKLAKVSLITSIIEGRAMWASVRDVARRAVYAYARSAGLPAWDPPAGFI